MDIVNYVSSRSYEYQKPYAQRYQEKHRERLLAKRRRRYICDCGSELSIASIYNHINTQKHQLFMKSLDICVSIQH